MLNNQVGYNAIILVGFIIIMYFLLIRPQKKKEQETEQMRNNIDIGDEIVTIGGIMGKVVRTKDDSLIIQVGADKTKFEIKRWAVSSVNAPGSNKSSSKTYVEEQNEAKKAKPKRLGKKDAEEVEAVAETTVEAVKEELPEPVEVPTVEEAVEQVTVAE